MKNCNYCEQEFNDLNNYENHSKSYNHYVNETKAKFKELRHYTLRLYSESL